jgi:acyl-CoA synthetase (AMP-forming)/AMP-acid ligase II
MSAIPRDIPTMLSRWVATAPDATALEARSGTMTYRQLDAAVSCAAGAMYGRGVRPGDRVAACLPNDLAIVVAFYGAMRLGAVWVGIGSALAAPEKARLIAHSDPRIMLTTADVTTTLTTDQDVAAMGLEILTVGACGATAEWEQMLEAGLDAPPVEISAHAPAGIAYTSGTTGSPKGVVHSQHNLLMPGAVVVSERSYGPALRKGDCLPLTILNVMALSALLTAQAGGCCVVMDRRDVTGVVTWIRESRVTVWNGVPTQLSDLVRDNAITRGDLETLDEVWCGGAGCRDDLRDEFTAKFGQHVRATYGLTEVPTIAAMDPVGRPSALGSSGRALPHLSVTVRDDHGEDVPADAVGELCIAAADSGPWANQWKPMLGWWQDGDVQPAPPGPLRTGDLGTIDDAGWVRVVDRIKLLIVRGGANVYPSEVESVLLEHPSVAGAAVFGIEDDRFGERVAALVEIRAGTAEPTGEDLAELCAIALAHYKIPEVWGFVPTLPRNAMGKVVRRDLADMLSRTASSKEVRV